MYQILLILLTLTVVGQAKEYKAVFDCSSSDASYVKIIACAMSLSASAIEKTDVLPFVEVSPNSFIDTIGYQNDGYALMTFK